MPNRVVHFEIQASNPERAMKFYRDVFGWEFPKWMDQPPYWGIMTAPKGSTEPGIHGGLLMRNRSIVEKAGVNAYVCTVQVESYDDIHKKIMDAGGIEAMPKFAMPGMAWQGYYIDLEGNIFGIHQPDANAK